MELRANRRGTWQPSSKQRHYDRPLGPAFSQRPRECLRLVVHLMVIVSAITPVARARQPLVTTPRGKFADVIKGVSWGPIPLKGVPSFPIPQDDWMVLEAKPMWSERGRGDLRVMRQMGANLVRLYGNVAEAPHLNFLDEALRNDLKIVPGLSDWPFTQMPGSCRETGWYCYNQIKDSYRKNLEGGFLVPTEDGQRKYHEAIQYMIVINEPDLKTPPDATFSAELMRLMARAIVSAVDGMLDAERDAGVVGPAPMFTVTMSFATCRTCNNYQPWEQPAMNQFVFLEEAMLNPASVGYTQNNDLALFYRTRWLHGANTQNSVPELRSIGILGYYTQRFPQIPLWIGEYHKPGSSIESDVTAALQLSGDFPLLWGISFFQYQKAYWKGGTEEEFGAWALGSHVINSISYYGSNFNIYCLQEVIENGHNIPRELTNAFGGEYVQVADLCRPTPEQVQISEVGFATIKGQQDADKLAVFAERVANHIGFDIRSESELKKYAEEELLNNPASSMDTIIQDVVQRPWWVSEDCQAICIADRDALVEQITGAVAFGCGNGAAYCGDNIPQACRDDIFYTADWILSNYYSNIGVNPLENCYAGGAAIYAPRSKQPYNLRSECIKEQVVNVGCQDSGSSGGGGSGLYGALERVTVDRGNTVRSSLKYACNAALCEVVCDDTKGCNSFIFSSSDCVCYFMDKCIVSEDEPIVAEDARDHHYQTFYKKECVTSWATPARWPAVTALIPLVVELLGLFQFLS